ncbi:carbohydrate ABC transporter permease [Mycetocola saprophilus]|uniref:carbohydrate ABC transporter permease n=1 Tax=Mycetocola saprophilus TaxID=76636 RepID=UPI0004BF27A0|nr:carbohydrate ABC transporter permease [Mycetocola saprophilus]
MGETVLSRGRASRRPTQWVTHTALILGAFVMVAPFIWQLLTSMKTIPESRAVPPTLLPGTFNLSSYERFFDMVPFWGLLAVSLGALLLRVAGQLLICALAAYGFARFEFRGRNLLFGAFLIMLMAPSQLFIIAQFDLVKGLGMLDTVPAIALPGIFSAFGTFLMRQAFLAIPREFEEAARLDGAGSWRIFWQIMLPMTGPTLAALTVLTSLYSWNDLLWPLIVTSSKETMTLPVGLAALQGQYGTDYPLLMAGSFIVSLPLIIIFVALQRQFFAGIASSGLKG